MKFKKEGMYVWIFIGILVIINLFLIGFVMTGMVFEETTITDTGVTTESLTTGGDINLSGVLFVDGTNGRVGIGTASPGAELEISGDIFLSQGAIRNIKIGTSPTNTPGYDLLISAGGGGGGTDIGGGGSGGNLYLDGGGYGGALAPSAHGDVILANSLGNVGIGVDNPSSKLHVDGILTVNEITGLSEIQIKSSDGSLWCCKVNNTGSFYCFVPPAH